MRNGSFLIFITLDVYPALSLWMCTPAFGPSLPITNAVERTPVQTSSAREGESVENSFSSGKVMASRFNLNIAASLKAQDSFKLPCTQRN
ncbi:MAG: hypothetical protein ACJAVZ_003913 [Afipia broomeae]|jgi:hypothetical protein